MSERTIIILKMKHIVGIIVLLLIIGVLSYTYYPSLQEHTVPNINPSIPYTISIDLNIPRKIYRVGDQMQISGIVRVGGEPFKGMYVQLILMDSANNTIWIKQVKTDDDGVFKYSHQINEEYSEGEYTLYAVTIFIERKFDYEKLTIRK